MIAATIRIIIAIKRSITVFSTTFKNFSFQKIFSIKYYPQFPEVILDLRVG